MTKNNLMPATSGYLDPIKLTAAENSPGLWVDEHGTYYEAAARAAAPVSGQGASELPSLPAAAWTLPIKRLPAFSSDQMRTYGQLCAGNIRVLVWGLDRVLNNADAARSDSEIVDACKSLIAYIDSRPRSEDSRAKVPTAYAIYGINGGGKHFLRDVKVIQPTDKDEGWRSDDDGLGDSWSGNEALYSQQALASTTPQKADNE